MKFILGIILSLSTGANALTRIESMNCLKEDPTRYEAMDAIADKLGFTFTESILLEMEVKMDALAAEFTTCEDLAPELDAQMYEFEALADLVNETVSPSHELTFVEESQETMQMEIFDVDLQLSLP